MHNKYIKVLACHKCGKRPLHIKKSGLCIVCYQHSRNATKTDRPPPNELSKYAKGHPVPVQINHRRRSPTPYTPKFIISTSKKIALNVLEKYGIELFDDLDKLKDSHVLTLKNIGDKYNITRERIRQIFKGIHGFPYTVSYNKLMQIRNNTEDTGCVNDPRHKISDYKIDTHVYTGALGEYAVLRKCEELGYDVLPQCSKKIDLKINGFDVDVKTAKELRRSHPKGIVKYYRFSIKTYQRKNCDFIIGYIEPKNIFYVFPKDSFSFNGGKNTDKGFYIRDGANHHPWGAYATPMHEQYKEAWHLLKK